MKKCFLIGLILIFNSCSNIDDNDVILNRNEIKNAQPSILQLSKKLETEFIYKTEVKANKNGSIFVEVINAPLQEMYFDSRLMVLRQRIVLILANTNFNGDSLFISFIFKEAKGEKDLVCYTKNAREFIISRYSSNLAYKSFNDYLYLNVDGSKMDKFSIYLKVTKENNKNVFVPTDYVELVYNYLDESQGRGNSKTKYSKKILEELKRFLLETKDWKEFNEEDINYFLNYKF